MQLTRQTPEQIAGYVAAGHWTPQATVDFWADNAARRGDVAALTDGERAFTWGEGWRAIRAIAGGLVGLGLQRDARVLVRASSSALLLLFRAACELAGVIPAFAPAGARRTELTAVAERVAPAGLLLDDRDGDEVAALRTVLIDRFGIATALSIESEPGVAAALAELATGSADGDFSDRRMRPYELTGIVTSSGTTGTPKCLEYACWPRLANSRVYIERLGITVDDTILSCLPCYSGGGDMQYHLVPQAGARLLLQRRFDPRATCATLVREGVTGAVMVPTMIARIAALADLDRFDFPALRWVVSNGSMLPYELAVRFEAATGAAIIQGYGMMDFGGIACHAVVDPQQQRLRTSGRLLPGTEYRIVAVDGTPLPADRTGELQVRGPHGSGGQYGGGDEDAWQDGFFRTGDLGHVTADGWVVLDGRLKDVIIRGGQNINAGEIEALLCRHPSIAEAAVVGIPDPELGERACAFVVPRAGTVLDFAAMVAFMRAQQIAVYKIPERLETVAQLPLTAAGHKIDKRALAARLQLTSSRPAAGGDPPTEEPRC